MCCFRSSFTLDYLKGYFFTFSKGSETVTFNRGVMNKDIVFSIAFYKTISLLVTEPLYRALKIHEDILLAQINYLNNIVQNTTMSMYSKGIFMIIVRLNGSTIYKTIKEADIKRLYNRVGHLL